MSRSSDRRRTAWLACLALVAAAGVGIAWFAMRGDPALAPIEDVPGRPRVLLIGDSISIHYTLPVRRALAEIANVHRPPVNCRSTSESLAQLDTWLADGRWDVIHFNWGLHDLKYVGPNDEDLQDPDDPLNRQNVPPLEYETNLRRLVERLQRTGATLVWRATTPVPPGAHGRRAGDAARYNAIAARVMADFEIATDDSFALVASGGEARHRPADVHFTERGSQALAEQSAAAIRAALAGRADR